jgi:hypothetical protein
MSQTNTMLDNVKVVCATPIHDNVVCAFAEGHLLSRHVNRVDIVLTQEAAQDLLAQLTEALA